MNRLLALLLVLSPMVASDAIAQDYEDLDEDSSSRKKRKKKKERKSSAVALEDEVVREVEKGFYLKSGVGSSFYLGTYGGGVLRSGTNLAMIVGQDFVDNEKSSMAWEVAFQQGVHNGLHYELQNPQDPTRLIQGDTRTFSFLANYEYSFYPVRRFGMGFRVGGGLMLSPLLMDRQAYERDVVTDLWRINPAPAVHETPHPLGLGGVTLEYYTKLSHFSIGADVDASYAVGFDFGISVNGYLKYTF